MFIFLLHNNTQPWSSFSWASGYPLSRYIYQITLHFWHTFKQFSDNLGIVVWHSTGKAISTTMHPAFCLFLSLDTFLHQSCCLVFFLASFRTFPNFLYSVYDLSMTPRPPSHSCWKNKYVNGAPLHLYNINSQIFTNIIL